MFAEYRTYISKNLKGALILGAFVLDDSFFIHLPIFPWEI